MVMIGVAALFEDARYACGVDVQDAVSTLIPAPVAAPAHAVVHVSGHHREHALLTLDCIVDGDAQVFVAEVALFAAEVAAPEVVARRAEARGPIVREKHHRTATAIVDAALELGHAVFEGAHAIGLGQVRREADGRAAHGMRAPHDDVDVASQVMHAVAAHLHAAHGLAQLAYALCVAERGKANE